MHYCSLNEAHSILWLHLDKHLSIHFVLGLSFSVICFIFDFSESDTESKKLCDLHLSIGKPIVSIVFKMLYFSTYVLFLLKITSITKIMYSFSMEFFYWKWFLFISKWSKHSLLVRVTELVSTLSFATELLRCVGQASHSVQLFPNL